MCTYLYERLFRDVGLQQGLQQLASKATPNRPNREILLYHQSNIKSISVARFVAGVLAVIRVICRRGEKTCLTHMNESRYKQHVWPDSFVYV